VENGYASTRALAQFAAELAYHRIPQPVIEHLKSVSWTPRCGLFGSTLPWSKWWPILPEQGGKPAATVWGRSLKVPARRPLANGTAVHSLNWMTLLWREISSLTNLRAESFRPENHRIQPQGEVIPDPELDKLARNSATPSLPRCKPRRPDSPPTGRYRQRKCAEPMSMKR